MADLPLLIEDLTFRYNSRSEPAIQHISFSAQAGEVVLFAGASGCGKTTLARCIKKIANIIDPERFLNSALFVSPISCSPRSINRAAVQPKMDAAFDKVPLYQGHKTQTNQLVSLPGLKSVGVAGGQFRHNRSLQTFDEQVINIDPGWPAPHLA